RGGAGPGARAGRDRLAAARRARPARRSGVAAVQGLLHGDLPERRGRTRHRGHDRRPTRREPRRREGALLGTGPVRHRHLRGRLTMATATGTRARHAAPAPPEGSRARRPRIPAAVWLIAPSIVFITVLFAWPLAAGIGASV